MIGLKSIVQSEPCPKQFILKKEKSLQALQMTER